MLIYPCRRDGVNGEIGDLMWKNRHSRRGRVCSIRPVMRKTGILFCCLLLGWVFVWPVSGSTLPEGGREMLSNPEVKAYVSRMPEGSGSAETVPVAGKPFGRVQRVIIPRRPDRLWDIGARALLSGAMLEGDTGVVTFEARALPLPGQAPGEATAEAAVMLEEVLPPSYPKAAQMGFRCGPEWRTYYLPFRTDRPLAEGKGTLVFHLGLEAQALEFGPVQVLNYGRAIALKDLPRTTATYPGRDADAPWRKEALERISKLRTGPLTVSVRDAVGHPVPGAQVKVRQVRSAFGFGSAVTAQMLTAGGPDGDRYRKVVSDTFSRVVFENDMKMEFWEESLANASDAPFRWDRTQEACDWLKKQDIGIRGHYLCWAPWEPWSESLRGGPEKIKKRILDHIPRVAREVGGRVMEWDAINHLAGWDKNIDEVTGLDFYSEVMRACRAATKLPLWVNEDQVFRPGRQQEDYYIRIQKLIADGCKPDGIGNQAHFDSSYLPAPQHMLAVSDRFAALVPALEITEFDVVSGGDEQLEADFLRDCLILCYSHQAYTGFLIWGFWEGAHWKPEAALWRKDWSEKPAAAVWRGLVSGQWTTTAEGVSNTEGAWTVSAHFGIYEITASANGKTRTVRVPFVRDAPALVVELP
ncbi:MAG: hypothetical protein JWM59_407 [Verrucomicrobiales bacterium]|nr:hypothetical protein [Verrucomicrobiales bacterium]